ncbi:MAG: mechanosensitive ion channel family protein [Acidobacteriota bacterium]
MQDILSRTYYQNTVEQWLVALLIIVGAVIAGKILYWIFGRVVRRLTAKTKTRLDDIIVDMIEEPTTVVVALFGIWYGANTLTLPDNVRLWVGQVFQVLIVLTIAWVISRLFDSLYREYLVPLAAKTETDLDDQILPIARKSVKVVIWALAIIIALDNAGYNVGALLAGLGIGGLALAMAAKDTVSNIFGGFTIFVDKPFTLNDRVIVAGLDGVVKEVGLRSTRLETLAGRIVTIPNSTFSDSPVENVSAEPSRKVVVGLGLTYDTTPEQMEQAMDLLKGIAAENPALEEKVVAAFTEYGDFSMNLTFVYYIKKGSDIFGTQSAVNLEILRKFNEKGLEMAFPTQTLYTKKA